VCSSIGTDQKWEGKKLCVPWPNNGQPADPNSKQLEPVTFQGLGSYNIAIVRAVAVLGTPSAVI